MSLVDDIELRPMRDADRNWVMSSWQTSYAGRGRDARKYRQIEEFYEDYNPIVRALVDRCSVVVACLREDAAAIAGWVAWEGDVLHYVHVRHEWRRLGVARLLLSGAEALPVVYTHRTNDSVRCPIPPEWRYRRFKIWPQEKAA